MNRWHPSLLLSSFAALAGAACGEDAPPPADTSVITDISVDGETPTNRAVVATRAFPTGDPTPRYDACPLASPLVWPAGPRTDATVILQAAGAHLIAHDPLTGAERWRVTMPAPENEKAFIAGAPLIVDDLAVVAYQTHDAAQTSSDGGRERLSHLAVVVDLSVGALDSRFATATLGGPFISNEGGEVAFPARNAFSRANVAGIRPDPEKLGFAYVTYGNIRDIQPWHGFAFELDLDAWVAGGEAVSARFVDTPEEDCGRSGVSGSRERICGGGLWAPSGPLVVDDQLILASGNGQIDIARHDFANTVMRVPVGLAFEPGCDADLCADFDPDAPSEACVSSCKDLFIPRGFPVEGPGAPESGICDGLTMFECWQQLDYKGGSTPALVELPNHGRVLAYPTKDGAVYLIDWANFGTQLDRKQLVAVCGTKDDPCIWDWAGMVVTQPTVTYPDGAPPRILVPTFMPDRTHPAGIVALDVIDATESEGPRLEVAWTFPPFDAPEAVSRFREHSTRVALQTVDGVEIAWVVEALRSRDHGRLIGLSPETGAAWVDQEIHGPGSRFVLPAVVGDHVYFPSCSKDRETGYLEGYRVTTVPVP